jgi:hypothetical protein
MLKRLMITASAVSLLAGSPVQSQTPPPAFADLAQPSSEVTPHEAYVRAVARSAYIWGWPMVNMLNRHASVTSAPHPGLLGGVVPVAPEGNISMLHDYIAPDQRFIACPNQDVAYGNGFFDLASEPAIVQVPDFGDRFWVYAVYDQRTDQFGELGKPYATKPGFYMLVGPDWQGEVPEGVAGVLRSPTGMANMIPRIFMNDTDEDRAAIQPLVNQVTAYPLSQFDGTMKTVDWAATPDIPNPNAGGGRETAWVVPEKFFDQLPQVLDMVPPLPAKRRCMRSSAG